MKWVLRRRGENDVTTPRESPAATQFATVRLEIPNEAKLTFDPNRTRRHTATEVVKVPPGVIITIRRSRTIEHSVEIGHSTHKEVEAGLRNTVIAEVRKAIEKVHMRKYQETETVECEVTLNGDKANQYALVWYDVLLTGKVDLKVGWLKKIVLPVEFRQATEIEVIPGSTEMPTFLLDH
jgi:hypothetical protein